MKINCIMAGLAIVGLGLSACGKNAEKAQEEQTQEATQVAEQPLPSAVPTTVDPAIDEVVAEWAGESADTTWYVTDSGLKYRVVNEGEGVRPSATSLVLVNYEGKLPNGTVFDSSYQRGEPISFPLNGVIAGWTEGVQLMPEGSKYIFYIPSDLAYGPRGAGELIGPDQDLLFVVDLLKVQ